MKHLFKIRGLTLTNRNCHFSHTTTFDNRKTHFRYLLSDRLADVPFANQIRYNAHVERIKMLIF